MQQVAGEQGDPASGALCLLAPHSCPQAIPMEHTTGKGLLRSSSSPSMQQGDSGAHTLPGIPSVAPRSASAGTPPLQRSLPRARSARHLTRSLIGCCLLLTHVTGAGAPRPRRSCGRALPGALGVRAACPAPPRPLAPSLLPSLSRAMLPTPTRWQCRAACPLGPGRASPAGPWGPAQPCHAPQKFRSWPRAWAAGCPLRAGSALLGLGLELGLRWVSGRFALHYFSSPTQRISFGVLSLI